MKVATLFWHGIYGDRLVCAGTDVANEAGGCQRDSSGPFVCEENGKWVLRPAVSWGNPMFVCLFLFLLLLLLLFLVRVCVNGNSIRQVVEKAMLSLIGKKKKIWNYTSFPSSFRDFKHSDGDWH